MTNGARNVSTNAARAYQIAAYLRASLKLGAAMTAADCRRFSSTSVLKSSTLPSSSKPIRLRGRLVVRDRAAMGVPVRRDAVDERDDARQHLDL